tara:strand:- start:988 stop:1419 length:432 start_codon:yes stop_codon:yes gene_type:complete
MANISTGSAKYEGFGKSGKGHVSTGSGALKDQPYGFNTRFEDAPGTDPEELIGAAHASCFTMALAFQLADKGFSDGTIETTCDVTLEKDGDGFKVSKSALSVKGGGDGLDRMTFEECAKTAKENCPLSKLLDTEITLETEFTG